MTANETVDCPHGLGDAAWCDICKHGVPAKQPEVVSCRSCGAEIMWGTWPKSGKRMPIDVGGAGDLVLDSSGFIHKVPSNVEGSTSHFATCPEAGKWRK